MIERRLGAELLGNRAGAVLVGVDDGDKRRAGIARIMIGVKAAKITGANHGDANLICHGLYRNSLLGRMSDACFG
jgi:hypothetical protein